MASRLVSQTSGHMPGGLEAMRVMSRKPPAARRSSARWSMDRWSATVIRVAAVRWGTWDTTATMRSCSAGGIETTSAPRPDTIERRSAKARPSVRSVGVSTHTAPRKRVGSAPATPSRSEPAMGWPPTKRGSSTASQMERLTEPTSVTSPAVAARTWRASSATALTGVATKEASAWGSVPTASMAPSSRARAEWEASRS